MIKKIITKAVIFCILLITIYFVFPSVFEKHRDAKNWQFIYNKNNKVDMLVMGSSVIFTGLKPAILDTMLELSSFILGSSEQNITQSYYNLLEVLEYQKPTTIILDANTIFIDRSDQRIGSIYHNLSGMKLTSNKINSFLNTIDDNTSINKNISDMSYFKQFEFIFTLITKEKFNWKNKIAEQTESNKQVVNSKGYLERKPNITKDEFNNYVDTRSLTIKKIPSKNSHYLKKFLDVCKTNNIVLIIVKIPTLLNENIDKELYTYIDKYNFKYYNFETSFSDFDFSYIEYSDFLHLSSIGAEKFSLYFGNLLKKIE